MICPEGLCFYHDHILLLTKKLYYLERLGRYGVGGHLSRVLPNLETNAEAFNVTYIKGQFASLLNPKNLPESSFDDLIVSARLLDDFRDAPAGNNNIQFESLEQVMTIVRHSKVISVSQLASDSLGQFKADFRKELQGSPFQVEIRNASQLEPL